jgi:tetratricopeptide (TPR) repeat protein
MTPLQPPDSHHLRAAIGWLELGNPVEAQEECGHIAPGLHHHPEVLKVRWEIFAKAKKWELAAEIANRTIQMQPENPFGYIHLAFALHEMKRTQEAWDTVLPIADKFPALWTIPYNLSCYASQMGQLEAAEKWLKVAMNIDEDAVMESAATDPDLDPLRASNRGAIWNRLK